jgi:branched-chain amino acid transport system ATP-binding protein
MSALLAIEDLTVGHGPLTALHGVSLDIAPGEIVALVGGNGAGKSTLLKAVMGLVPGQSGSIRLDGEAIDALPPWARARRGLGYCPEGRRVFPGLTVEENLDVVAHAEARADGVYKLFPALALRRNALGWQLSGGEQQMLAVGRALMAMPRLLLLDEPSLGLSPRLVGELFARLRAIANSGTAVLLAEQNTAPALAVADRAYVFQLGRVVDHGPASEKRLRQSAQAAFLS